MRLLNTHTGEFSWISDITGVKYAILSHVWSTEGEQSYQDLLKIQHDVRTEREHNPYLPPDAVLQKASPKIRDACAYASADGFDLIWIDSCCIDKTSSAELSEAINSMYYYYSLSTICYAHLADVDGNEDPRLPDSHFRWSRWYTRGWTLQELIAPETVIFVSSEWRSIGTKSALAKIIEEVTGIDAEVLTHNIPLSAITVARRMSWASKRVTTRKEDEAYSLMGIFSVNMPAIYGEGNLAFARLQEEILKQVPDQSIFVWDRHAEAYSLDAEEADEANHTLFASSPAAFAHSGSVKVIPWDDLVHRLHALNPSPPSYIPTSHGLRTSFPLLSIGAAFCLGFLACADEQDRLLALVLKRVPNTEVHSVGTAGWTRIRSRYRPSLRALTWEPISAPVEMHMGVAPPVTSLDPGGKAEGFTRIVRFLSYPHAVPVSSVYVAHRPLIVAAARAMHEIQLADQDARDDLFADGRRGTGLARGLCDMFVCGAGIGLAILGVTLTMFLILSFYRYAMRSGGS